MKSKATFKGLITGMLMVLLSIVFYYQFHFEPYGPNQMWVIVLFIAGMVWSLLNFHHSPIARDAKLKDYFSEGFRTFIVITLIMVIYTAVFYKLNPQILDKIIEDNENLVLQAGDKTPAEILENTAKLRSIFMPMTISITTVTYLIFGAVTSLIGGLFLKNARGSK
ncbi:MAG: DUF4199 domain-containing protein [Ferruginibacter sp.]